MKTPFARKISLEKTIQIGQEKPSSSQSLPTPENLGQLPLDVFENSEEIRVIAPLAGVKIEDTEVVIHNDVLTIKGERLPASDIASLKGADCYAQECFWGKFSRSIILPLHADTARMEAVEKDHILYLRIPKKPNIRMRIVRIQSK